jgi:hypothetical protein
MAAISWDISALDFVDPIIGCSLQNLIMKIESRQTPGQQLFHFVDETWNHNGFHFAFFPNVEAEARSMMMALIPFLVHHYHATAVKWFSSVAQTHAHGSEWDPEKGYFQMFDDAAVSWMMKEDRFLAFDQVAATKDATAARPGPSNLQAASGTPGLIDDQDSVGTFGSKVAGVATPAIVAAPLVTGVNDTPVLPRVLPAMTTPVTDALVDSRSTRCSFTASLVSRISQMEATLAKVDKLDTLMHHIIGMMEGNTTIQSSASPAPPAPPQVPHAILRVSVTPAVAPITQPEVEIRQSPLEQASADVSTTDVGQVG